MCIYRDRCSNTIVTGQEMNKVTMVLDDNGCHGNYIVTLCEQKWCEQWEMDDKTQQ